MSSMLVKFSVAALLLLQLCFAFKQGAPDQLGLMEKRDIKQEWEDLGWAWGKRSDPNMMPRRFLRALHPMKKNPDWGDLGWTWGRK